MLNEIKLVYAGLDTFHGYYTMNEDRFIYISMDNVLNDQFELTPLIILNSSTPSFIIKKKIRYSLKKINAETYCMIDSAFTIGGDSVFRIVHVAEAVIPMKTATIQKRIFYISTTGRVHCFVSTKKGGQNYYPYSYD